MMQATKSGCVFLSSVLFITFSVVATSLCLITVEPLVFLTLHCCGYMHLVMGRNVSDTRLIAACLECTAPETTAWFL